MADQLPDAVRSTYQNPPVNESDEPQHLRLPVQRQGALGVDSSRLQSVTASPARPNNPLSRMRTSLRQPLTLELCLFPFLFPHGYGGFNAMQPDSKMNFSQYLEWRMKTAFSQWTLCKPYVLIMYNLFQVHTMAAKYSCQALENDIEYYRRVNSSSSLDEIYELVAKFKVPGDFIGSPTWHRTILKDVQCMVEHHGMPTLFLTLTADEVSELKFPEIDAMEFHWLKDYFGEDEPHMYSVRVLPLFMFIQIALLCCLQ